MVQYRAILTIIDVKNVFNVFFSNEKNMFFYVFYSVMFFYVKVLYYYLANVELHYIMSTICSQ